MVFNRDITAPSGQVNFQGTAQDTLLMNNALGGMQKVVTDQFAADDTKKAAAALAQNNLQKQLLQNQGNLDVANTTADASKENALKVYQAAITGHKLDYDAKMSELESNHKIELSRAKNAKEVAEINGRYQYAGSKITADASVQKAIIDGNVESLKSGNTLKGTMYVADAGKDNYKQLGVNALQLENSKNQNMVQNVNTGITQPKGSPTSSIFDKHVPTEKIAKGKVYSGVEGGLIKKPATAFNAFHQKVPRGFLDSIGNSIVPKTVVGEQSLSNLQDATNKFNDIITRRPEFKSYNEEQIQNAFYNFVADNYIIDETNAPGVNNVLVKQKKK